jgi:hypothetical protein
MRNWTAPYLCVVFTLCSAPASAAPTSKDSPVGSTDPFEMLYAQCAYLSKSADVAPREKCKSERERLTKQAEHVVAKFYGNFKLRAMTAFQSNLDRIERSGAEYDPTKTSLGPQYFAYSKCLAESTLADEEYLKGKWLIGQRAIKLCQDLYARMMAELPQSKENRKPRQSLWLLKDDFSRLRAVPLIGSDFSFREGHRF